MRSGYKGPAISSQLGAGGQLPDSGGPCWAQDASRAREGGRSRGAASFGTLDPIVPEGILWDFPAIRTSKLPISLKPIGFVFLSLATLKVLNKTDVTVRNRNEFRCMCVGILEEF